MSKTKTKTVSTAPAFVSERYLAGFMSVSTRTIQKYRLTGRGPRFYRIGGAVRYRLDDVKQWLESRVCSAAEARVGE